MPSDDLSPNPSKWRSSHNFMTIAVILVIFTDTFLFGFVVPILGYMFEVRLQIPPNMTQRLTTAMLTGHGIIACISAPIIAHVSDRMSSRRIPILFALAAAIIGTALIASTLTIEIVFAGRVLQALAGTAAWILGYACLSDNIDVNNIGQAVGTVSAFVSIGTISGPSISGPLLKLLGYWPTWVAPFLILLVAFAAWLLLVDGRSASKIVDANPTEPPYDTTVDTPSFEEDIERTALLRESQKLQSSQHASSSMSFYQTMLLDVRVLACLSSVVLGSAIMTGFDATIPLHLRDIFEWDTLKVGLVFFALQIPTICFGRLIGRLRDRVGVRYPTALGWLLMSPFLIILGIPGDSPVAWINTRINAEALYVCALLGIGFLFALVRGAGAVRLIGIYKEMESENPAIFGSYGGSARVFSMTEVSFSLGCMFGPLISGSLVEVIGYFYMNVTLASICVLVASFIFFTF